MKNYLKALIVFILVFACAILCVSCGNNSTDDTPGNDDGGIVQPPPGDEFENDEESYRIRFVYSYTAKVVNDNGRTENKKEVVTVKSIYVPVDENELTAEHKTQIAGLTYHGFSFVNWYADWDTEAQKPVGEAFNFDNAGKITKDIVLYGDKGKLAGPNATWRIEYEYAEPDEEVAEGETPAEGETETPDAEPAKIGATLYIEGTGKMFNFENGNEIDVGWYKDSNLINKVVISEGITSVGSNSFKNFAKLTEVVLPSTIEVIGDASFQGFGVKKIAIPANVKKIEKNAFANTSLKEVILNDGIETIADQAFYGSNKIGSVVIPASLKSIGNSAFHAGAGNSSHNLSKVFFKGDEAGYSAITIAMDNIPLTDRATKYYYVATPADYGPDNYDDIIGNFWHYADEENQLHPVQYCYTLKYLQPSSATAFAQVYIPAAPQYDPETGDVLVDEDGVPTLKGVVTDDILKQHYNMTYNGYNFAAFKGGKELLRGTEITADQTYNCDRGNILSVAGGIKFTYASGVLTISKDDTTAERVRVSVAVPEYEQKSLKAELGETDGTAEIARLVAERWAANEAALQAEYDAIMAQAFRIWDFPEATDTGALWTGAVSGLKNVTQVIINEGVEYIGNMAFNNLTGVNELVLPASLKSVHKFAFSGCSGLISVYYKGSLTDAENGCPDLTKLGGIRSTVYGLVTAPTGDAGNYWMENNDARIAWTLDLEKGALTIGGDSKMVDFANASDAPWFAAKDQIKSVAFAKNISFIGKNVINGYANVTSIELPNDLKAIPASAFEGTGIVTDTTKYNNGMLMINGHLIKVDPAVANKYLFETAVGTNSIADGALAGCDAIKRVYIINTVKYINAGAFPDSDIEYIFCDTNEAYWTETVAVDIDFGDATVFFKSAKRPTVPAVDEEGNPTGFTEYVDGKYWYKSGNDYVVWGCMHVWSDWFDTEAPTCASKGLQTRYCIYDKNHTDTKTIPMLTDHSLGEYVSDDNATCQTACTETARCTQSGCTYSETRTIEGATPDATKHDFSDYVADARTDCTKVPTETSHCKNEGCVATDTRDIADAEALATEHKFGDDGKCTNADETLHGFKCEVVKEESAN